MSPNTTRIAALLVAVLALASLAVPTGLVGAQPPQQGNSSQEQELKLVREKIKDLRKKIGQCEEQVESEFHDVEHTVRAEHGGRLATLECKIIEAETELVGMREGRRLTEIHPDVIRQIAVLEELRRLHEEEVETVRGALDEARESITTELGCTDEDLAGYRTAIDRLTSMERVLVAWIKDSTGAPPAPDGTTTGEDCDDECADDVGGVGGGPPTRTDCGRPGCGRSCSCGSGRVQVTIDSTRTDNTELLTIIQDLGNRVRDERIEIRSIVESVEERVLSERSSYEKSLREVRAESEELSEKLDDLKNYGLLACLLLTALGGLGLWGVSRSLLSRRGAASPAGLAGPPGPPGPAGPPGPTAPSAPSVPFVPTPQLAAPPPVSNLVPNDPMVDEPPVAEEPPVAAAAPVAVGAALRVAVMTEPAGLPCEWTVQVGGGDDVASRAGSGAGVAEFADLAAMRAQVTTSASGFIDDRQEFTLPSGGSVEQIVTLRARAVVAGRVDGPDGPLADAQVLLAAVSGEAARTGVEPARATTDAQGRFEFDRVFPSTGYAVGARHADYVPVVLDSVSLAPGERKEITVQLPPSTHLLGRLQDHRGQPLGGVRLDLLVPGREDTWLEESTLRTGADGSFRTAPVTAPTRVMLRAALERDGVNEPVNRWLVSALAGATDLGVLAIRSHVVTFRLPEGTEFEGLSFMAAGELDPASGAMGAGTATRLTFDEDGAVRIAGLGPGLVNYSAWSAAAGEPAIAHGSYEDDGTDQTVQLVTIPPEPPRVLVTPAIGTGVLGYVLLVRDGDIAIGGGARADEPFDASGYVGDYRIYVIDGANVGWTDATLVPDESADIEVSATSVGEEARMTVLYAGEPVLGASIGVYGFVENAGTYAFSWGRTDANGEVTLRGIPPGVDGVRIAATAPSGTGRMYFVPRDKFGGATLDLRLPDLL